MLNWKCLLAKIWTFLQRRLKIPAAKGMKCTLTIFNLHQVPNHQWTEDLQFFLPSSREQEMVAKNSKLPSANIKSLLF